MANLVDFVVYLIFYLFVIVVGYQYIRERNLRRLMGWIAITVIVVLYTIGKIFFPRSPFTPTFLPPVGLLACIYYLTYPKRRNRVLTVLSIIFIEGSIFLVVQPCGMLESLIFEFSRDTL